jgi:hypothetical protein
MDRRGEAMKITAQMGAVISVFFALFCYGFAVTGFMSLDDAADLQKLADAKGFAWFWTFLGTVGVVFGAVSWWMAKSAKEGE